MNIAAINTVWVQCAWCLHMKELTWVLIFIRSCMLGEPNFPLKIGWTLHADHRSHAQVIWFLACRLPSCLFLEKWKAHHSIITLKSVGGPLILDSRPRSSYSHASGLVSCIYASLDSLLVLWPFSHSDTFCPNHVWSELAAIFIGSETYESLWFGLSGQARVQPALAHSLCFFPQKPIPNNHKSGQLESHCISWASWLMPLASWV